MRARAAGACTALALAALLVAAPAHAADRAARTSSVVVREGPASTHPGIGLLQRGERVRFFGERDGWTEVGLRDGRHGWVPSAEVMPVTEPAATASPGAEAHASEPAPPVGRPRADVERLIEQHGQTITRLGGEIEQLRQSIDRLAAGAPAPAALPSGAAADPVWTRPDGLLACAVAFVLGIVAGAAVQRRRIRRERSLRF